MNKEQLKEPEEYVSTIKYLSELIQMDLNFGRAETVLARVNAIISNAIDLRKLYLPPEPAETKITKEEATEHYKLKSYSEAAPQMPGLYLAVCEESDWIPYFVALTINDYKIPVIHCAELGNKHISNYCSARTGLMWLKAS